MTDQDKKRADYALNIILNSHLFLTRFENKFPNNTVVDFRNAINSDLICKDKLNTLSTVVPECFNIGNKVLLKGEEREECCDFDGDGELTSCVELYDMTTEMKTGESYTMYVSSTYFFEYASLEQVEKVVMFLDTLK